MAEAGWQPRPPARSGNPEVLVERFGPDAAGQLYLTFLNDSNASQQATVQVDFETLSIESRATPVSLPGEVTDTVRVEGETIHLNLTPEQTVVIRFRAK